MMNDDDFGSPREVELVDSFAIDLTFPVGTVTDRTTYNGQFGLAQIDLSFNLTCLENYFGPDCSQFCDKSISNCSCGPGFTGEFCQTNIDDCARLSVNCSGRGRCVDGINNFSCECEPGYSGTECESETDECVEESVVCGLNMHCEDGLNNYTCVCDLGFTGEFCQTNIDDCARLSVNCSGRGRCVDGINNYTCVCDSGFTGISCMYVPTFDRVPVVVGGVAGLVALLTGLFLIVVIVAAVCKRRRSKAEEFDDLQLNPMYGVVHIQGHQTSAENIGVLESESYIETKPNIVYGLTTDRDGQSKAVEFLDNRESMQGCEYEYIDVDGIYNRYE